MAKSASPPRSLCSRATLSVAAALAGVVAVDVGVRWACPIPGPGYIVWSIPPGSAVTMESAPDGFAAKHRYNRLGFRGPDFEADLGCARRVACIGDSFTDGLGAAEDESWPSALGRRLADLDCQVFNLGCSGADPRVYGQILCEAAAPLRPTDVIVCMLPADLMAGPKLPYGPRESSARRPAARFADPFRDRRAGWGKLFVRLLPGWTYLADRARGRWPRQQGMFWAPWTPALLDLAMQRLQREQGLTPSQARRLVQRRIRDIDPQVLGASTRGKFHSYAIAGALVDPYLVYRVRVEDMGLPEPELRARTQAWLKWYAAKSAQAGAVPWLLFFPQACQVSQGPWGPLTDACARRAPRVVGDTSVRDLLAGACRSAGVRFIDAMPALRRHQGEKLYYRYDTHPTGRAYAIVAEVAASELRRARPGSKG